MATEPDDLRAAARAADNDCQAPLFGRRVLDNNGEVDPTIFPAISDVQLAA
jgi:hypothetical protein